jgi:hypothetical protein
MKRTVKRALLSTGFQFVRVPNQPDGKRKARPRPTRTYERIDRLVEQPTFILSSVRSGSTLLRVILNSHSQICAPHELHLRTLHVSISPDFGVDAMKAIGLDGRKLEHLLWDRILDRELVASGKRLIVDKTPNTVFIPDRLREAWPQSRFIYLLRHPGGIADSLFRARDNPDLAEIVKRVLEYTEAIDAARSKYDGLVVRYEDLASDPQRVTKELCAFLGVKWEAAMVSYGEFDHGPMRPRLGDWKEKIKSGQIDSDIVVPDEDDIPAELVEASRSWGYL